MNALARHVLDEVRAAGGDVKRIGNDRLKLVAPNPLPDELVQRVRAVKPKLIAMLGGSRQSLVAETKSECLDEEQEERAAIIEFDGRIPRKWQRPWPDCTPTARRPTFHLGSGGMFITTAPSSLTAGHPGQHRRAGPRTICLDGFPARHFA
jgi:hypothetical protein